MSKYSPTLMPDEDENCEIPKKKQKKKKKKMPNDQKPRPNMRAPKRSQVDE